MLLMSRDPLSFKGGRSGRTQSSPVQGPLSRLGQTPSPRGPPSLVRPKGTLATRKTPQPPRRDPLLRPETPSVGPSLDLSVWDTHTEPVFQRRLAPVRFPSPRSPSRSSALTSHDPGLSRPTRPRDMSGPSTVSLPSLRVLRTRTGPLGVE